MRSKTFSVTLAILLSLFIIQGIPASDLSSVGLDQAFLIDSALSQVGLTSKDLHFDEDEIATWGGDKWRLRTFDLFHRNPLKLPRYGSLILERFSDNASNLSNILEYAGRLIDYPVFRRLNANQLERYTVYPDSVSVPSITRSKNILVGKKYNELKDRIDLLYRMADDKESFFKKALKRVDKKKYRQRMFDFFINENDEYHDLVYELESKIDFSRMIAGAQDYAEAVRRGATNTQNLTFPKVVIEMKTRKGLIVIGTSGNDRYTYMEPPFVIFDGGGDDTYEISGFTGKYPLSVIIDIGGNDKYISTDTASPGIGGAVLGMSILVDISGDDYYQSLSLAQGAGIFGVGILADLSGNDKYISRTFSQGAGSFGAGILIDSSGTDSFYCWSSSQGFGYTRGSGILFDYEGDDSYVAEDDTLINPSSQTEEHNSSLAQGVGFGKRADFIDGRSWAGGVGLLVDANGNDSYSAGLFAQGCAYWYAVGMLIDGSGDDEYSGVWYVQGSAAHFGVGYLDDFAGNDSYRASNNMAIGAGHDFSLGYFNERGGNDRYSAPNLSLGGGNANGIGIFHDHSGDDQYQTDGGVTLGRSTPMNKGARRYLPVFGIFIDGGGNDSYNEPYATNGIRWISPGTKSDQPAEIEIGVGIDW